MLVYHATHPSNLDSILSQGLRPGPGSSGLREYNLPAIYVTDSWKEAIIAAEDQAREHGWDRLAILQFEVSRSDLREDPEWEVQGAYYLTRKRIPPGDIVVKGIYKVTLTPQPEGLGSLAPTFERVFPEEGDYEEYPVFYSYKDRFHKL